ncbi:MAG: DUF5615 family PIN-like protein [Thermoanaerobaculia bacterium]
MKFLLDEDLPPAIAQIASARGLAVESVHEIDRRGESDEAQLAFAAASGCTLLTRSRDDFIRLSVDFYHASRPHLGVLIVPHTLSNRHPERVVEALRRWAEKRPEGEASLRYLVDFLGG